MAKTGSFKELVQTRAKNDKKFAEALLREGIDAMLSGDVETGKTILRDYIKATVGWVIRRPGISLVFSVIFRSARVWNFTSHRGRGVTDSK